MGVIFDNEEKKFLFDFGHDGTEDIGLSIRSAVDNTHKKITLQILNEDNEITIFSLIGRKDLMAESM